MKPQPFHVKRPQLQVFMSRPYLTKTILTVAVASALAPWILASSASSAITPPADNIRMSADKQSYNMEKKTYSLSGHVNVSYQEMRIIGTTAEVSMDSAGKPQVANFFNRPMFKRVKPQVGEDQVVGDIIKVYLNDDRYGAEGNVDSHIVTVAADPFHIRSDVQEFDNKNKVVSASGNVHVDYKGSQASSALANVRMKESGKADRAIFTGGARIKQENSEIFGDRITVMVDSGNLIAEHNVKTRVDLKNQAPLNPTEVKPGVTAGAAAPATTPVDQPDKVFISSDYQQYDKASDMMIASGNVKILYGDYIAIGPKATFKLKGNDLDRIFLTGRPTITDNGRTVTGDRITITTNPKNFDAVGNVKVNFKANQRAAGTEAPHATVATNNKRPAHGKVLKGPNGKPLPTDDPADY
jgi:lipopolysaccharide export system protein LptA